LAIEVDGCSHEDKQEYDLSRQRKLERLGVRFIRFDNIDIIRGMSDVIRTLLTVITEIEKNMDI